MVGGGSVRAHPSFLADYLSFLSMDPQRTPRNCPRKPRTILGVFWGLPGVFLKPQSVLGAAFSNSCHGLFPLALHWALCQGHGLCLMAYQGPRAVGHVQFAVHLALCAGRQLSETRCNNNNNKYMYIICQIWHMFLFVRHGHAGHANQRQWSQAGLQCLHFSTITPKINNKT